VRSLAFFTNWVWAQAAPCQVLDVAGDLRSNPDVVDGLIDDMKNRIASESNGK